MAFRCAFMICLWLVACLLATRLEAQIDFELPPIHYESQPVLDDVSKLKANLEAGRASLTWREEHGYLKDLLEALEISVDSQTLVFSKTSLQLTKIDPDHPRALYFNDNVYIGWVQCGDVIEIGAVDPQQGAIFYTLDQTDKQSPRIERISDQCLSCHGDTRTQRVPGFLVRSVFPRENGHPDLRFGSTTTSPTTPFEKRFGGWYVTGTHGQMRHRGNQIIKPEVSVTDELSEVLDQEPGANCVDLSPRLSVETYLSGQSDLIALMVLEHQSQMHNLITLANYETRRALFQNEEMNRVLERGDDFISETTQHRIESVAEQLVDGLLFAGEFPLTSPIAGTSGFTERFSKLGPFDARGRSLRQFNLQTRLFEYPCSFLIDSDQFNELPDEVLVVVVEKLRERLCAGAAAHAGETNSSKIAVWEILEQTWPKLKSLTIRP